MPELRTIRALLPVADARRAWLVVERHDGTLATPVLVFEPEPESPIS